MRLARSGWEDPLFRRGPVWRHHGGNESRINARDAVRRFFAGRVDMDSEYRGCQHALEARRRILRLPKTSPIFPTLASACYQRRVRAGSAAVFAAEEFFFGTIRNEHTRRAYLHAVRQFLAWCETRSLELPRIAPRDVGQYLTSLAKTTCGFRSDGDHESEVMSISNPN